MKNCDLILTGIGTLMTLEGHGPLLGRELGDVNPIPGPAAIAVTGGRVVAAGAQDEILSEYGAPSSRDLEGALVTPGLVDCHTHPLFHQSRAGEFEMRLAGDDYESILAAGGGILSSVRGVRDASDDELADLLRKHLRWLKRHGVVAVECKSGYGLSLVDERRSLQIIAEAQGYQGLNLLPTCLAAHVVPPEFKGRQEEYLDLVCDEILPSIATDRLAVAVDVFVERGAFTGDDARRILNRAAELGLGAHLHADQLSPGEGTAVANECGALSADHLEYVTDEGIAEMARLRTTAVLLPGSTFFLGQDQWAPARKLIDAGVPVALATDFNPGSSPTANPAMIMTLACLKLGMTPTEALAAFTRNAAYCLRIDDEYGSIQPGKRAAFAVWEVDGVRDIPYWFGSCTVRQTLIL